MVASHVHQQHAPHGLRAEGSATVHDLDAPPHGSGFTFHHSQSWASSTARHKPTKLPSPCSSTASDNASTFSSSPPASTTSPATSVGTEAAHSTGSPAYLGGQQNAGNAHGTGRNGLQQRTHPRRTAVPASWRRPQLVRQEHRRQMLVEQLVDSATALVAQIWPMSDAVATLPSRVISLRFYIRETLRRSRTSYSTLQVTLWYLVLIRPFVVSAQKAETSSSSREEALQDKVSSDELPSCALLCGRRMFLAALILASKYLQDRNFTTKAWSKITGLPARDIILNETLFLQKINWNLHFAEAKFKSWNSIILSCTDSTRLGRNLLDTWSHVLSSVQDGKALQDVANDLTIERQHVISGTHRNTYEVSHGLLTPEASFGPASAGNCLPDDAGLPSPVATETNSSPAMSSSGMSSGGESSASAFSVCELEASAPPSKPEMPPPVAPASLCQTSRLDNNSTAQQPIEALQCGHLGSQVPGSGFVSERCSPSPTDFVSGMRFDKDGPTSHPSQALSSNGDMRHQMNAIECYGLDMGSGPLVSTVLNGNDLNCAMRAAQAQQPNASIPHSAQSISRPSPMPLIQGLNQQSIAHRNMKQPLTANATKRPADCFEETNGPAGFCKMQKLRRSCTVGSGYTGFAC